jgi:hypothetical protein
VADTVLDKRKTCKQTKNANSKRQTINESLKAKQNRQMQSLQEVPKQDKSRVLTQQDSTRPPQNKQNIWFGKFGKFQRQQQNC